MMFKKVYQCNVCSIVSWDFMRGTQPRSIYMYIFIDILVGYALLTNRRQKRWRFNHPLVVVHLKSASKKEKTISSPDISRILRGAASSPGTYFQHRNTTVVQPSPYSYHHTFCMCIFYSTGRGHEKLCSPGIPENVFTSLETKAVFTSWLSEVVFISEISEVVFFSSY